MVWAVRRIRLDRWTPRHRLQRKGCDSEGRTYLNMLGDRFHERAMTRVPADAGRTRSQHRFVPKQRSSMCRRVVGGGNRRRPVRIVGLYVAVLQLVPCWGYLLGLVKNVSQA